eukprot:c13809_g1_i1 orf=230-3028(-)
MELPLQKPCTKYFVTPFHRSAGRVRVRLPRTYSCFFAADRLGQSVTCWKKTWSGERFAVASQWSLSSPKTVDFAALCRNRAPLLSASISSPHIKGKHREPQSVSSPNSSDTTVVSRKKEGAIALSHEQIRHSRLSESVKDSSKLTSSKASNSVVATRKSSSKGLSSEEHSSKPVSPRETCSSVVVSGDNGGELVTRRKSRGNQVWSRANGGKLTLDPGSFEERQCGTSKELSSHKPVGLFKSKSKEGSLNKPVSSTSGARIVSARSSRRRKASRTILSEAQIEEEKARKREVLRERLAMAEANGFRMSKRAKKNPEEVQLVLKLNLCSKHGDLHGALEVYDKVKKGEIFNLKQHHYNVLLYICSGAASGSIIRRKSGKDDKGSAAVTSEAQKQVVKDSEESINGASKGEGEDAANHDVVSFSPEDRQLAAKRGTEIYEDMLQAKIPANEATFTSVARLAVAKGDGDLAFEMVKRMTAANIIPKLRTYGPALLCFCESNQVEKAFEVDDHMVAAGILPDENLLEALLKLSVKAGLEEKFYSLLQRLRMAVRDVSPATVMTMERWFNSEAAAFAGKAKWDSPPSKEDIRKATEAGGGGWHGLGWLGKGAWTTRRSNISKEGVCLSCGETLCTIDLDPEETEKFAKSVAELAMQREYNSNEFVAFQEWLDENGPFEAVLDGANIGMYNSALRGFNYKQVATVASAIEARNSTDKPPLIVLHCRRTSDGVSRSPRSQNIIEGWISNNVLYSTPNGSNDDWYWLYAAVNCKCLLVTNDEMRDHLFELLGNDFFPKWKERHQVRFTFSGNGLELHMPPPYSTVIQESQNGSWHIPQAGGDDIESPREWLCVTRSIMDSSQLQLSTRDDKESVNGMVLAMDIKEPASDCNHLSPSIQGTNKHSSLTSAVELPLSSALSETCLKLEAAEKLSNTTINYEI